MQMSRTGIAKTVLCTKMGGRQSPFFSPQTPHCDSSNEGETIESPSLPQATLCWA